MLRKRKLASSDYLLLTAFLGVVIVGVSGGLQAEFARISGIALGLVIMTMALALGFWQSNRREQ